MGAFRVTVQIRNKEIDILYSHIEFSRKVTTVIGGRVTFSIESTQDTDILEIMVNGQFKPISGRFTFYKIEDNSVFRIIEFRCAYIVFYKEVFNVDKRRPLFTTITLSSDVLVVGNAFLTNSW